MLLFIGLDFWCDLHLYDNTYMYVICEKNHFFFHFHFLSFLFVCSFFLNSFFCVIIINILYFILIFWEGGGQNKSVKCVLNSYAKTLALWGETFNCSYKHRILYWLLIFSLHSYRYIFYACHTLYVFKINCLLSIYAFQLNDLSA